MRSITIAGLALASALPLAGCASDRGDIVYGVSYQGQRRNEGAASLTPMAALRANVGGRVFLVCLSKGDQTVEDCEVAYENPVGWGFGAAALKMEANLSTRSVGVVPRGGKVLVPIAFCQTEGPCTLPPLPEGYNPANAPADPTIPEELRTLRPPPPPSEAAKTPPVP